MVLDQLRGEKLLIAESFYQGCKHNLLCSITVSLNFPLPKEIHVVIYFICTRAMEMTNISKVESQFIWGSFPQISEIHVTGESEDMTAKERLLLWSQQMTEGYVGVRCDNFTTSWKDGRLFNAIIHKYR